MERTRIPDPVPLTIVGGGLELPALVAPLLAARPGALLIGPDHVVESAMAEFARLAGIHGGAMPAGVPGGMRIEIVEPDVGERSAGCPCCRDRLDVVEALLMQLRRRQRPTHVIVAVPGPSVDLPTGDVPAADGGSDGRCSVTTVAHTVLSDPDLRRHVRLDAVVTSLDAVAAVTRLRTGDVLGGPVELERLAVADRLVIGRADQVADDAFVELVDVLRTVNRIAPVLAPAVRPVRPTQLLGVDAWHGAPTVSPAGSARELAACALGTTSPRTVVLEQQGTLDPGGVEEWLDEVIRQHAPRLHRLQGALAVDGQPHRMCCHGVGSYAMSHPEHEDRPDRRSGSSLVVLIGEGLPATELADDLARTVLR